MLDSCRTEIEWHPGKCLTQKVFKKKPKKGAKNAKPIIKTEKCDSFFNFFNPPEVPEDEEDIDDDAVRMATPFMVYHLYLKLYIFFRSCLLFLSLFVICTNRLKNSKI